MGYILGERNSNKDRICDGRAEYTSIAEKAILSILSFKSCTATAVQKLGLLVESIFHGKVPEGFSPLFFGGFDDDLQEGLETLQEEGYIRHTNEGNYQLTSSGEKLLNEFLTDEPSSRIRSISSTIVGGLKKLTDDEIIAVVYQLFPELTNNSLIKNRLKKSSRIKNVEIVEVEHEG